MFSVEELEKNILDSKKTSSFREIRDAIDIEDPYLACVVLKAIESKTIHPNKLLVLAGINTMVKNNKWLIVAGLALRKGAEANLYIRPNIDSLDSENNPIHRPTVHIMSYLFNYFRGRNIDSKIDPRYEREMMQRLYHFYSLLILEGASLDSRVLNPDEGIVKVDEHSFSERVIDVIRYDSIFESLIKKVVGFSRKKAISHIINDMTDEELVYISLSLDSDVLLRSVSNDNLSKKSVLKLATSLHSIKCIKLLKELYNVTLDCVTLNSSIKSCSNLLLVYLLDEVNIVPTEITKEKILAYIEDIRRTRVRPLLISILQGFLVCIVTRGFYLNRFHLKQIGNLSKITYDKIIELQKTPQWERILVNKSSYIDPYTRETLLLLNRNPQLNKIQSKAFLDSIKTKLTNDIDNLEEELREETRTYLRVQHQDYDKLFNSDMIPDDYHDYNTIDFVIENGFGFFISDFNNILKEEINPFTNQKLGIITNSRMKMALLLRSKLGMDIPRVLDTYRIAAKRVIKSDNDHNEDLTNIRAVKSLMTDEELNIYKHTTTENLENILKLLFKIDYRLNTRVREYAEYIFYESIYLFSGSEENIPKAINTGIHILRTIK